MKLIVCVDDNFGILFNDRRVSRDSAVISKICELVGPNKILVSEYSSELFSDFLSTVEIVKQIFKADVDDYIFVEEEVPKRYFKKVNELYLFRWNRKYPSDVKFTYSDLCVEMTLISTEKFIGNSHPEITLEVYKR